MAMKIGFIGQGWIGKNYANDYESRGFSVVRYGLEPAYAANKEKIEDCDIVLIAVPTPTTPEGFQDHIVREAVKLVGKGKIAVIKSTIVPGTTESIQKENQDRYVFHSPEFLSEATAAYDAAHPDRNIIGIPIDNEIYRKKAQEILDTLPEAKYACICSAREAEVIKYAGNCLSYTKVIFVNLVYNLAEKLNCDWKVIRDTLAADPRIGKFHIDPVHKTGRGAGGSCFIKDFAALKQSYATLVDDKIGEKVLEAVEEKNIDLLLASNKDIDLLKGVYGKEITHRHSKNR